MISHYTEIGFLPMPLLRHHILYHKYQVSFVFVILYVVLYVGLVFNRYQSWLHGTDLTKQSGNKLQHRCQETSHCAQA